MAILQDILQSIEDPLGSALSSLSPERLVGSLGSAVTNPAALATLAATGALPGVGGAVGSFLGGGAAGIDNPLSFLGVNNLTDLGGATGVIGDALGAEELARSRDLLEQAVAGADLPPRTLAELTQSAATLDPNAQRSFTAAQDALTRLAAGGISPQEALQRNIADAQAIAQEKAARDAAVQNFRRRGFGGSGAELAAGLGASQSVNLNRNLQDIANRASSDTRAQAAATALGNLGSAQQGQATQLGSVQDVQRRFGLGEEVNRQLAPADLRLRGSDLFRQAANQRLQSTLGGVQGATDVVGGIASIAGAA